MNQGKLEVVKQEMVRVNVDILGIRGGAWQAIVQGVTKESDVA